MTISKEMRRVLRKLYKAGPLTADEMGCSVSTLVALSKRKFIWVETTFNSIAFPRRALTSITDDGMKAIGG